MSSEVIVAPLMSALFRLSPSTRTKVNKIVESPISHEPSEMQSSFILGYRCCYAMYRSSCWLSSYWLEDISPTRRSPMSLLRHHRRQCKCCLRRAPGPQHR